MKGYKPKEEKSKETKRFIDPRIVSFPCNWNDKKIPEPYHNLFGNDPELNSNGDSESSLNSESELSMKTLDKEEKTAGTLSENQNEPIKLEHNYYSDTRYIPEAQDSYHKFAVRKPEPNYYSDDKFGDTYTKGSVIKHLIKESAMDKPLFSKDENGNDTVKISDINQKSSGDCWLLSVLGSIAVVDPKLILDTVKEEDNNQVSITFKNLKKPIIVDRSIFKDKESNYIMSTNKDDNNNDIINNIWVQMIEKAAAILKDKEYKDKNKVETNKDVNVETAAIVKDKQHKDKGEEPINYGRINSREPEEAFELFSNEGVNIYGIFKIKEKKYFDRIYTNYYNNEQLNIYQKIKDALKHNKPVVYGITGLAGPPSDIAEINKEPIKAGLAAKHAYSVVGVGKQDGRLFIKIRNPWGNMGVKYMHNGEKYIPVGDETNNDGESELDLNYMFATNGRVYIAKYNREDSFCNDEDIEECYPGSECSTQNEENIDKTDNEGNTQNEENIDNEGSESSGGSSLFRKDNNIRKPIPKYVTRQTSEVEDECLINSGVMKIGKNQENLNIENMLNYKYKLCYWHKPLKVEICENVKVIDDNAFSNFENVIELVIPNSIEKLGDYAFMNCSKLKKVTILGDIQQVGENVFSNCNDLENVIISGNSVKHFSKMFSSLHKLKSATINVTTIESFAFANCTHLETVIISKYLKTVQKAAFYNCSSLESIIIPGNVETIEKGAFGKCNMLEQIDIPSSVKTICPGVFSGCTNLKTVKLNDDLKEISDAAFNNCSSLEEITIPSSVGTIGHGAFANCTNLRAVNIQNAEDHIQIAPDAFNGCPDFEINYINEPHQ